jgi:hypothetical protein
MTVTRYVGCWVQEACVTLSLDCAYRYDSYDGIHLVGRAVGNARPGVDLLHFLIGRRLVWLARRAAGGAAAGAGRDAHSAEPLLHHGQLGRRPDHAHPLHGRSRRARGGSWRWWLLFGFFLGLVVASRVNVAPLAAMAGVAALIWLARRAPEGPAGATCSRTAARVELQRVPPACVLAGLISLLTFRWRSRTPLPTQRSSGRKRWLRQDRSLQPCALVLGSIVGFHPEWLADMAEIQGLQQPEANYPPALQWTGRAPLIFPFTNMVLYGMGIAAGIVAWLGFFWALWRIARARPDWTAHALPVAWSGLYFCLWARAGSNRSATSCPFIPRCFCWAPGRSSPSASSQRPAHRAAAGWPSSAPPADSSPSCPPSSGPTPLSTSTASR